MRYKCLILDHDDTVVLSSAEIHYPSFVEIMRIMRPEAKPTFSEFIRYSHHPGFMHLLTDVYHFTPEECEQETAYWRESTKDKHASFVPGMQAFLERFRAAGGRLAVASHSFTDNILRDYEKSGCPPPELLFTWDDPPELRKPSPWPVQEALRRFGLNPREALVVDDLRPGLVMACAAHVKFAAALWAYDEPTVRRSMEEEADYVFASVGELEQVVFCG